MNVYLNGINNGDEEMENDHTSAIDPDEALSDAISEDDEEGSSGGGDDKPEVVTTAQLHQEIRKKAKPVRQCVTCPFTGSPNYDTVPGGKVLRSDRY